MAVEELASLLNDDDYDDDFLKPTEYAVSRTKDLLTGLESQIGSLPHFYCSTCGNGDVRTEWRKGDKEVRLVISDAQSYIYWDHVALYGAVNEVTVDTLVERIKWLGQ